MVKVNELEEKARRRIRRFIETGVHQARVRQFSEDVFMYIVKHHGKTLFFKRGVDGRLWKREKPV